MQKEAKRHAAEVEPAVTSRQLRQRRLRRTVPRCLPLIAAAIAVEEEATKKAKEIEAFTLAAEAEAMPSSDEE